jgi:hypothetical protein
MMTTFSPDANPLEPMMPIALQFLYFQPVAFFLLDASVFGTRSAQVHAVNERMLRAAASSFPAAAVHGVE